MGRRHPWAALLALTLVVAVAALLSGLPTADASPMRPLSRAFKRTGAVVRRKAVAASSQRYEERRERKQQHKQHKQEQGALAGEDEEAEEDEEEWMEEQEVATGQGPVGGRRALQRRHQRRQNQRRRARALDVQQEEGDGAGEDTTTAPGPKPEPMKIAMDFQIMDPRADGRSFSTLAPGPEVDEPEQHSIFAGKESLLVGIAAAIGAAVLVAGAVLLRQAQRRRAEAEAAEERERACLQQGGDDAARRGKRPQGLGSLGAASAAGEAGTVGRLASARGGGGGGKGKIVVREESLRGLDSTRGGVGAAALGPGATMSPMSTRGEFFNLSDIDLQQSPGKGKGGAFLSVASPRK